MTDRRCTMPDCSRKHIAKGMCAYHYNLKNYPGPKRYRITEIPCGHCGVLMKKQRRTDRVNQFCSYACRDAHSWAATRERERRRQSGVVERVGMACRVPASHPSRRPLTRNAGRVWVCGACAWCGETFVIVDQLAARYCSRRCAGSSAKSLTRFVVPRRVRMAIYDRDGWICQLCFDEVDPDLGPSNAWAATLDHIECQSWALIPDHSPSNLRLAHRWCNSVRGDERYYTAEVLTA